MFTPVTLLTGGRANDVEFDGATGELFAWFSRRGAFRSADGGASWTECAPSVAESMAVGPDGSVYLAVEDGDVVVSTDRCATWQTTALGVPANALVHDATRLLAATELGLRSFDGNTWSVVTTPFEGTRLRTVVTYGTTILIGSDSMGVARSIDGGQGWTVTNTGLSNFRVVSLAFAPSQPDRVYAVEGSAGATTGGLFRSDNGGSSWTMLYGNGGYDVAVDPADPDHVVFANFNQLFEVFDGTTATPVAAPELENGNTHGIAFDTSGGYYVATTRGVFHRQGAGSFSPRHGSIDAWRLERASTSTSRDTIHFATATGVLRSADGGKTFALTSMDFGPTAELNDVLASTTSPGTVYAAGRYVSRSTNDGAAFAIVFDSEIGNGYDVNALAESGTRVLGATNTRVVFADPPLSSWTSVTIGGTNQKCTDIVASARGVTVLCETGVYESTDNGQSFLPLAGAPIGAIAIEVANDTLFVGTGDGLFTHASSGWTRRGLAGRQVHGILVDGTTWVVATDLDVHASNDDGATWAVLSGLAGRNPRALVRDRDGALLVGTAGYGLFRTPFP